MGFKFGDLLKVAIIGAAVVTGVGLLTGGVAAGAAFGGYAAGTVSAYFASTFVTQLVLGAASYLLADKGAGANSITGTLASTRDPVAPTKIVYGRTRLGGTIVYLESTENNKYLHAVVALAGHEIDAVEKIYFGDDEVPLDGSGNASSGVYSGKARIQFKLGTDNQTAFADLVSESDGNWTNNHRLQGRAVAYIRLEYDQNVYTNGMPAMTFQVRGKKVYDPRSSQTVWSQNPALCLLDYMTSERYGLGLDLSEVDLTVVSASANACDVAVPLNAGGSEVKYACNGWFDTSATPERIIQEMLTSMSGKATYSGGVWRILAGIYYTPTLTFDENDLRGGLTMQTLVSRRENFNGVKGVFSSADDKYVATDFPSILSSTFVAEDGGEEVYKSINLPFTTSPSMAQRLAKIELLKARQQITVTMPCKLNGLKANVGDIIYVNNERFGWSNKQFEVVGMGFAIGEVLGVDLSLREISTDVFDWSTSEEQAYDPAPNTTLPNAWVVSAPTDLQATPNNVLAPDGTIRSGLLVTWTPPLNALIASYEIQYIRGSANFDWGLITTSATDLDNLGLITTTADTNVDYGSITEQPSSAETQYNSFIVTEPYYVITDAYQSIEYSIRVRAINQLGVRSEWATTTSSSAGDTTPPSTPTALVATGGYRMISLRWINPSDADFSHVEIYKNTVNNSNSSSLVATINANRWADTELGINETRFYWILAVDRTGNKSDLTSGVSGTTEFVDSDSFTAEVMNLFSEAGAYGIEPVATLPANGDFDGQIKYDTTNNKLWRWDATGSVWSDDIFSITAGSVDAASFAAGIEPVSIVSSLPSPTGYTGPLVVFNTSDNKLYRYDGAAWVTGVATTDLTGTLAASSFASNLRPVEVVASLPSTGNFQGRVVVLTTDSKLYRHNGTSWTAAVPSTDISGQVSDAQIAALAASKITGELTSAQIQELDTAKLTGEISGTQISDGAITAVKISNEAVTTAKIAIDAITEDLIAAGAITADKIGASAIDADKIAENAITSVKIADEAITTAKIALEAVNSDAIAAGAITETKITDSAITTAKINAGAITTAKISAGAITATEIASNAVTAVKISASAVTSEKIDSLAITTEKLAAGAITTAKISAGAITADEIASNAITAIKIDAAAVTTEKLAAGAVTANEIAANSVTAEKINADAVTAEKIASNAITAVKIDAGAVTTAKLDAAAVTTAKLAAGAVTADEIAANAITSAKIETGAITAAKVAAGAIETDKIAAGAITAAKVAAGAIEADAIAADAITAGKISAGAITSEKIEAGAIGTDQLAANSVTAGIIAAGAIGTDQLAANAITADKINAEAITSEKIKAGDIQGDRIAANTITGGLIAASGIITQVAQIENSVIDNIVAKNVSIGTLATGARLVMTNTYIKVYDASGILRVQIGDLNA